MCEKCGRTILLQSHDGREYVDIKNNEIRLRRVSFEEGDEYTMESETLNYCPICGNKIGNKPIEKYVIASNNEDVEDWDDDNDDEDVEDWDDNDEGEYKEDEYEILKNQVYGVEEDDED